MRTIGRGRAGHLRWPRAVLEGRLCVAPRFGNERGFTRMHGLIGAPFALPDGVATWRSGDAADCKSVHAGSIPAVASTSIPKCGPYRFQRGVYCGTKLA